MTLKAKQKIRVINGKEYIYESRPTKVPGSKFLQRKEHYVAPVRRVYKTGIFERLTSADIKILDRGWRKGMSVKVIGTYIKRWLGKRPADSSIYQWFAKRGVKRGKKA